MGTLFSAFGNPYAQKSLSVQLTLSAIDLDHAKEKAQNLVFVREMIQDELSLLETEYQRVESAHCQPQKSNHLLFDCDIQLVIKKS